MAGFAAGIEAEFQWPLFYITQLLCVRVCVAFWPGLSAHVEFVGVGAETKVSFLLSSYPLYVCVCVCVLLRNEVMVVIFVLTK